MTLDEFAALAEKKVYAGPGPYRARCASDKGASDFWYVCGPDGVTNVLCFPGGAVFTDRAAAEAIAARWSAGTLSLRRCASCNNVV